MQTFDLSMVKDPTIFRDNVLPAHCDARWFAPGEQQAVNERLNGSYLRYDRFYHDSRFFRSLNGIWKFAYATEYSSLAEGFEATSFDCSGWEDIRVPAHIQMEGYDRPHYTNTDYPWDGRENTVQPAIPERFNPVGAYVRYFDVPEDMSKDRIFISFGGVESAFVLYLNGRYVGYAEDSFTPSDFELTPYICTGRNKLAVVVFKWSTGSWLEDQDFFRFSGIFREVFLYTKPEVHIEDMTIRTLMSSDMSSAVLSVDLEVSGEGSVEAVLYKGAVTDWNRPRGLEAELKFGGEVQPGLNHFEIEVFEPLLWSAEEPNLYPLLFTVSDGFGAVCELVPQQIGFRHFELKDGLMQLNNRRIVFKGVNRHEFSSLYGRAITYAETKHDFVNIKQNNINAVRTCHYPDNSYVYALADNLGLYIIDETNMETHGTWSYSAMNERQMELVVPGDNPDWEAAVLDRVSNVWHRDRNHASILIWSCGNESYGGINIFKMSEKFRALDPTRLVHYEGVAHDRRYPGTSDMESRMYTKVADIERFLEAHPEKPFICCEYTHAMGNSCGGMHKYTELADTNPLYQGGFIWDYIDQSITTRDRYGCDFEAYGGDFGDRPSEYNFSGNGIACGGEDRLSSPKMPEVKFNYSNITADFEGTDRIHIVNKNLFIGTDRFDCRVELAVDGRAVTSEKLDAKVGPLSSGDFEVPAGILKLLKELERDPSGSGLFTLPETPDGTRGVTLTVIFTLKDDCSYASRGHEVAYGQLSFREKFACGTKAPATDSYEVIIGRSNYGARGLDFEVMFGERGLVSYRKGGKELIDTIPKPSFWRAPTDNDRGSKEPQRYAQWKIADLYAYPADRAYDITDDLLKVTYTYKLPTSPAAEVSLGFTVLKDGSVDTVLKYDPIAELKDMPLFGMIFGLDADHDRLTWYGMGPGETYSDRCHGNRIGLYSNRVSDNISAYLVPQECGNKIGVRYARVTDRRGRGMEFTADRDFELQAIPFTAHELENAAHHYDLPGVHHTYVRIAAAQLGVGGDDSWGAHTLPEYEIPTDGELTLSFRFRGI